MTNLVDRYVRTALRRIPEDRRTDIDRELRGSILDAVDARVEAGDTHEAAVKHTLLELGDPERLADRYADRSNFLIGPDVYPVWRKMMRLMFTTVLPVIVAVTVVVELLDDPGIGTVIGSAVSAALTVGAHLAFWTTLAFAVVERTGAGARDLGHAWTLKDLPQYHDPGRFTLAQLAGNLVWPVVAIGGLVLQQFAFTDVPVLDPANWTFWWPYLIGVLLLQAGYAFWLHRQGTWSHRATAAHAVLSLMITVPLIGLLLTGDLFNPALLPPGDDSTAVTRIIAAALAVGTLWSIADVAIRAERDRRGRPAMAAGSGNSYTLG